MALKGNLPEEAVISFRRALALNPFLWEAFEGLCALGMRYSESRRVLRINHRRPQVPPLISMNYFPPDPNLPDDFQRRSRNNLNP